MPNGVIKLITPEPTFGYKMKTGKSYIKYVFTNRKHGVNRKKVHQIVAEAFLGPKPFEGAVVMHLDDNPLNNSVDNLEWGSQKKNLNSEKFINYCKSRVGENSCHAIGRRNRGF